MANIKLELISKPVDGQPVTFVAPCNCNEITGLKVVYDGGSKVFTFKDANGKILLGLKNLFSEGAYVKAILDVTNGNAYLQNASTNAYLEGELAKRYVAIQDNTHPTCYYNMNSGTKEWINPPMLEGVEYRTTERWNGKPVYRKLVTRSITGSFGNASGYKELLIPHGIIGITHVVSCRSSVGDWMGLLPYVADNGGITTVTSLDDKEICLKIYKDVFNDPIFYFDLSYVKE